MVEIGMRRDHEVDIGRPDADAVQDDMYPAFSLFSICLLGVASPNSSIRILISSSSRATF
jgi:hypothetical protein